MPARNTAFTNLHKPRINHEKKSTHVIKRNLNQIEEIPNENEKHHRRERCLIGAFLGFALGVALILAGVLPALIVTLTRQTISSTPTGITNTGVPSAGNINATTISSITSISSSVSGSSSSASASASTSTSANGFIAGGAVLSGTTAWYGYEEVSISCSVDLINITIIIVVQKTVNATYSNAFNTLYAGSANQTYIDTVTQIIYTWTLLSGQTVSTVNSPYRVQAQFHLFGVNQPTSGDTFIVTATTITNITSTQSGTF